MKLYIRKRRLSYRGPLVWVWWCGNEPEGPRCFMPCSDGSSQWKFALADATWHAYTKHGVTLGDPLSDEEVTWGWPKSDS